MKISKDERVDIRNMPVGMSKNVYKEMVKGMEKLAPQEEPRTTMWFKCNM